MTEGEIGSAVLPYLATDSGSVTPWWLLLAVSSVVAVAVVWGLR